MKKKQKNTEQLERIPTTESKMDRINRSNTKSFLLFMRNSKLIKNIYTHIYISKIKSLLLCCVFCLFVYVAWGDVNDVFRNLEKKMWGIVT